MEKQAYTVAEVALLTGFSRQTISRIFRDEQGVLVLGRPRSVGNKRRYQSIRIPRAVYERVLGEMKVR
jgi:AraC-like DNA-binding protein